MCWNDARSCTAFAHNACAPGSWSPCCIGSVEGKQVIGEKTRTLAAALLLTACAERDATTAPPTAEPETTTMLIPAVERLPLRRGGAAFELSGPQYGLRVVRRSAEDRPPGRQQVLPTLKTSSDDF